MPSSAGFPASLGLFLFCAALPGTVAAQEGPGLGVELSEEQIAAWDINIAPDGTGLPPGSGDAREGFKRPVVHLPLRRGWMGDVL